MEELGENFSSNLSRLLANLIKVVKSATLKLKVTTKLTHEQEYAYAKLDLIKKTMFLVDDIQLITTFIKHTFNDWDLLKKDKIKFLYLFNQKNIGEDHIETNYDFLFKEEDDQITTVIPESHLDNLSRCFMVLIKISIRFLDKIFEESITSYDEVLNLIEEFEIDEIKIGVLKKFWDV